MIENSNRSFLFLLAGSRLGGNTETPARRAAGMRWGGAMLGFANRPGQILDDVKTLEQARTFFAG